MNTQVITTLLAAGACLLPLHAQNTGVAFSNAVDGYIEVPYSARVVPQSGITVEAWITYDDSTIPTGWRFPTLVRQGLSVGGSEDYFLRVEAGNTAQRVLRWKVVTAAGPTPTVNWSFTPGQLTTWTHVAATYDGNTAALYVNGALVGSATGGNGSPIRDFNSEVFRIGKGSDVATPIEVWNGEIDEVRLWPFARTAAEIQQTMNLQLDSVPGYVSTWNLDNHTLDTSGGQHATISGQAVYTPNTLNLTAFPAPVAFPIGASTPGCLGPLAVTMGSAPVAGNADFAAVATRAPANAVTFAGIAFAAAPAPLSIAGIDYWLDLGTSVVLLSSTDPLGTARQGVPLPAWLGAGQSLAFQFAWFDPCGPMAVTASDAVVFVTQ
ncbi:MAG: LamG domain-containing protein [Planctomycetes bacterium]|nr:LamG domain-containing protein [Planctomycetota bacterium]